MKSREVEQLMNKLKHTQSAVNPRPEWVADTRSRVLRHIELTTSETPARRVVTLNHLWVALSFIMPQRTVYAVVRPLVIFIACFGIGTGGWITTVSASLNSLPGDTLYPVKLASEHTQVAVVDALQGKAASTELRLSLVRRRAEEVKKIVNTPSLDQEAKSVRVQAAVNQLKTEVQSVSDNLVAVQQNNPSRHDVVAVAKAIEQNTESIKQNLVDTTVHATSADAVVAIDKLRHDAGQAQILVMSTSTATSTPALVITDAASSTVQITSSTIQIVVPAPSSTTAPVVLPKAPHTSTSTSVGIVITISTQVTADPYKNFPERPAELAPNVVDTATPIQLEAWE